MKTIGKRKKRLFLAVAPTTNLKTIEPTD
ncbi:unnamed protein product [Acanthoscelides obtectus]|uniref:Uncharacterized protein n=1 Tax=Acanthoscelides obtectus TaxID=200917 RepID=A0A9P0LSW2_ACAOB|nr:unnamed protein product [Acanthoscelides obtectus]CAK1659000.1 hypothetical protein AOBTE_LOCUS21247 [Acanthoscelides obtectus]